MTQTGKQKLHFWYGIALALFTVVVGALFIAQAADIYFGGAEYSRALVIERCSQIAVPFWLWVAAVAAGGILELAAPAPRAKLRVHPGSRKLLDRLTRSAAEKEDDPAWRSAAAALAKERRIRMAVRLSCLAVCLICAGVGAAFLLNIPAYPSDPNEAVLGLVRSALPCVAVAFLACCACSFYDEIAAKRMLPYAKALLATGGRATTKGLPAHGRFFTGALAIARSPQALWAVRGAVLAAAVALIAAGVANGGMHDVFVKAINICTECIGLG